MFLSALSYFNFDNLFYLTYFDVNIDVNIDVSGLHWDASLKYYG